MKRDALISPDGLYRYWLTREWGNAPGICWVMLNPSTADADVDDPTIRRCISFSKREGFGWLVVVNLYAYRATDPAVLRTVADPIGPDNNGHIETAIEGTVTTVAAWGAHEPPPWSQIRQGYPMDCLGTTKAGHPRHPLYVKGDTPFVTFRLRKAGDA